MFGSAVLDVAIALVLLYLVLSIVCSAVMEIAASIAKLRARNLRRALDIMIGSDAARSFFQHSAFLVPLDNSSSNS